MRTIAVYLVALAAVFAAAFAIGSAVGPLEDTPPPVTETQHDHHS
jgi:hypothetical protein